MSDHEPAVENGAAAPAQAAPSQTPPARPQRGGCVGRFFAALLVVIITTFIALAAVASGLLYLGFTAEMPSQLNVAYAQVGTLQAQNSALQTEVAAQGQQGLTDHETLGEIERSIAEIEQLRGQLRQEREAGISQNATLVAEAKASRDAVAVFATAEAGRAALLAQLDQRSARVERFLQRLSDIAEDTALDLDAAPVTTQPAEGTASAAPSPTPEPQQAVAPSPTPTPTGTAAPTEAATETATRTPSPTATPTLER